MNQHTTADRRVMPTQFMGFMLAGGIGLLGDALLNRLPRWIKIVTPAARRPSLLPLIVMKTNTVSG